MVPIKGQRQGTRIEAARQPPMAFKSGEEVKIAVEAPTPGSKDKPLYILDSKKKEHILIIDEITSREKQK